MLKWYEQDPVDQDIIISSRVRFARNIEDYKFSPNLSDDEAKQLVEIVKVVLPQLQENDPARKYYGCDVNLLGELDKNAMIEKQILRTEFAKKKQRTGLILSEDEAISVMVNEEDHIRIQVIHGGLDLIQAYEEANVIDDMLSGHFKFAFNEKYGYLTTSPANVGTGLNVSVIAFLPALTADKKIERLIEEVSKYGVTISPVYKADNKTIGSLYEISNQKTLGFSESELVETVNQIVLQVIRQEKKQREYVLATKYDEIEDQLHRAFGILKYAKSISSNEAMLLLSDLKYGIDTGVIKINSKKNIYRLMLSVRPNVIQWNLEKPVGKVMRDKIRAEYIHANLPRLEEA